MSRFTALLFFCVLCLQFTLFLCDPVHAKPDNRLLQIKAAFTYRFLLFTQWPAGENEIKRIGVVDNRSFATLFEIQVSQGTNKDKIKVIFLDHTATAEDFRRCHLLYIPTTTKIRYENILQQVEGYPVLTVSDMDSFLDLGGMIALFNQRNRVRFAVNRAQAQGVGISFNAKMLKLAESVVEASNEE
jgi:hypothetical protein